MPCQGFYNKPLFSFVPCNTFVTSPFIMRNITDHKHLKSKHCKNKQDMKRKTCFISNQKKEALKMKEKGY